MEIEGRKFELVLFHGFLQVLKSPHFLYRHPLLKKIQIHLLISSSRGRLRAHDERCWTNDDYGSDEQPTLVQPSSWPVFTGPLALRSRAGMDIMAAILLSLPGNIRFQGLYLVLCYEADVSITTALVEECCSTLESLEIDVGAWYVCSAPVCALMTYPPLGSCEACGGFSEATFVVFPYEPWLLRAARVHCLQDHY